MTIASSLLSERRVAARSRFVHYLAPTAFVTDALIMAIACLVGVAGRTHLPFFDGVTDIRNSVILVSPPLVAAWLGLVWMLGGYRHEVFGAGADEFKRVFNASAYAAGLLGVGCYFAHYSLSRGFYLLTFVVGVPALLAGRHLLRRALKRARVRGSLQERVIIVGGPRQVDDIAAVLRRERWLGYSVAGAVVPGSFTETETPRGVPVLARADSLHGLPDDIRHTDVLFITGGLPHSSTELRQLAWDLEHDRVQLVVAPSVTDVSSERIRVRPVGGLPLMHLDSPRWTYATRWAKRTFDVVGSLLLILATLPVLAYAALRIKVHDRGPVFFRHTRIGRNGAEFSCLKFRTMVVNAESLLQRLQEEQGASALLFKMKDDPRITAPGRWLRRFSIDELPQLFNVLRGDMSLVGPRPQVQREVDLYDDALRRRLHVRPGMTGLWQVSGRNDLTLEEAARLDLYYVDNWSMLQDLAILGRTVGAVLRSHGAY